MGIVKDGQGRVWWISNLDTSRTSIDFDVNGVEQAKMCLTLLSQYDLALGNLIQSNVGGYHHYHQESDEWIEYENNDGDDIWSIIESETN